MKIAFLIIDMQKEYFENKDFKISLNDATEYINEVSGYFRKEGQPVVHIQDKDAGDGPGSNGFEISDKINIADSDLFVTKTKCNSFYRTELENILRDLNVEYVIVSGFAAAYCVLFTYNGAIEKGFGVSMLQNGIAGTTKNQAKQTQFERDVINYKAVDFILNLIDNKQE